MFVAIRNRFRRRLATLLLCFPPFFSTPASASEPSSDERLEQIRFFESKIRPVLAEHCYQCHSLEAGVEEGGLRLDTRERIRAGGDRGPAVVAHQPEASWLLRAITHRDPDLRMPPRSERLGAQVIADFRSWIHSGADDPRDRLDVEPSPQPADQLWSYRTPVPPSLPPNDPWCRAPMDRFILQGLRSHHLEPAADASTAALLRRLHFDLLGLPPTPEQVTQFEVQVEREGIDLALSRQTDHLLQSPEFGRRWGRHWLDVARYGESSGKEANISFPYAWRYRDYVIDAFNNDIPFDRFLTEQLAGDLLPAEDLHERTRLLIATGFLAIGPKNLDATDARQFTADVIDEQIDAVSRVFMASSIACARCHDHKFDPVTMDDYYALAGIFSSTETFFGTAVSPANRVGGDPLVLPRLKSTPILHRSISEKKAASLRAQKAALVEEKRVKGRSLTLRDALRIFWRTGGIDGQLEKVDQQGRALPLAMGVLDRESTGDTHLLIRGDVNRPEKKVARGFPSAIDVSRRPRLEATGSGRLELADWLTSPDHPLTSRVLVNRVWSHLFGGGLVSTVDDFGSTGNPPSHPELLDHLATEFVKKDWSIKQLIRSMVLSRTYRQSSTFQSESFEQDAENRWLWRMPKRRIEAEAMRDAMLSVSGELDTRVAVGSLVGRVIGDKPISLVGLDRRLPPDLDGSVHRSVYLPILRDRLPDVLEVFDFASPSLVTGKRQETNVPTQSLYLMNSEFVQARAEAFARRLARETSDPAARIQRAFLYCYGRQPTNDERERVMAFVGRGVSADPSQRWVSCCHALLSTVEFRQLD